MSLGEAIFTEAYLTIQHPTSLRIENPLAKYHGEIEEKTATLIRIKKVPGSIYGCGGCFEIK